MPHKEKQKKQDRFKFRKAPAKSTASKRRKRGKFNRDVDEGLDKAVIRNLGRAVARVNRKVTARKRVKRVTKKSLAGRP